MVQAVKQQCLMIFLGVYLKKIIRKTQKRDVFPEWIEDLCHGKVAEVFLPERELDLEQVSIS